MIRPTTVFGLDTTGVQETARSVLLLEGQPSGRVRGCRIDAQFEVGDGTDQQGFVVLVSYDDMFSAAETAYFVDRVGTILDRLTLGHAFEQGLISEIAVDGPAAITFTFPTNRRHRLRVHRGSRLFGLGKRWLVLDSFPQSPVDRLGHRAGTKQGLFRTSEPEAAGKQDPSAVAAAAGEATAGTLGEGHQGPRGRVDLAAMRIAFPIAAECQDGNGPGRDTDPHGSAAEHVVARGDAGRRQPGPRGAASWLS